MPSTTRKSDVVDLNGVSPSAPEHLGMHVIGQCGSKALWWSSKNVKVALVDINLGGLQSRHIYKHIFEISAAACGQLLRRVPEGMTRVPRVLRSTQTQAAPFMP